MPWWNAVLAWWQRLLGRRREPGAASGGRVSGEPQSSNGASSMHLWWQLPTSERLTAVRATIEILEPPVVDRLYFWALQATFVEPDGGAAHLGLQHNRRHPGAAAANFGGYAPSSVGGLLDGADSSLPSAPNDPNTRDFGWAPHRKYRLSIERVPDAAPEGFYAWRGAIEDLESGRFSVVRVLFSRGEYLSGPVVWSEAFARCEHAPVAVRWSDLEVVGEGVVAVVTGSVNYQRRDAGGCDNTNMTVNGDGWVQQTATLRTVPSGTRLTLM